MNVILLNKFKYLVYTALNSMSSFLIRHKEKRQEGRGPCKDGGTDQSEETTKSRGALDPQKLEETGRAGSLLVPMEGVRFCSTPWFGAFGLLN